MPKTQVVFGMEPLMLNDTNGEVWGGTFACHQEVVTKAPS